MFAARMRQKASNCMVFEKVSEGAASGVRTATAVYWELWSQDGKRRREHSYKEGEEWQKKEEE